MAVMPEERIMRRVPLIDYLEREYGTTHTPIEKYIVNCWQSNKLRRYFETHRDSVRGKIYETTNQYSARDNLAAILAGRPNW